jgi:MoxR-like ATPase
MIKQALSALSAKTIIKVATDLSGGGLGFDPWAENSPVRLKALAVEWVAGKWSEAEITDAIRRVQGGEVAVVAGQEVGPGKQGTPHGQQEGPAVAGQQGQQGQQQGQQGQQQQAEQAEQGEQQGEQGEPTPAEQRLAEAKDALQKVQDDPGMDPGMKEQITKAIAEEIARREQAVEQEKAQRKAEQEAREKAERESREIARRLAEQAAREQAEQAAREEAERQAEKDQKDAGGHAHPVFQKVLRLCRAGVNVMLVGPAGCGKTYLAEQVATALGKTFGSISGSSGVSESQLTGRLLPTGEGGRFEYTPSVFVKEYESGGAFLFDEIDAFDPNVLLVANQALANGGFHVESRAAAGLPTYVRRGEGSVLIGSANTYGTGADMLYVGRNGLDAASADRWYMVAMTYDPVFEASLIGLPRPHVTPWIPAPAPTDAEVRSLGEWVLSVREKASAAKLRRVVSTRAVQKAIAARRAGVPTEEIKVDLLAGWSRDEKAKVGA